MRCNFCLFLLRQVRRGHNAFYKRQGKFHDGVIVEEILVGRVNGQDSRLPTEPAVVGPGQLDVQVEGIRVVLPSQDENPGREALLLLAENPLKGTIRTSIPC